MTPSFRGESHCSDSVRQSVNTVVCLSLSPLLSLSYEPTVKVVRRNAEESRPFLRYYQRIYTCQCRGVEPPHPAVSYDPEAPIIDHCRFIAAIHISLVHRYMLADQLATQTHQTPHFTPPTTTTTTVTYTDTTPNTHPLQPPAITPRRLSLTVERICWLSPRTGVGYEGMGE